MRGKYLKPQGLIFALLLLNMLILPVRSHNSTKASTASMFLARLYCMRVSTVAEPTSVLTVENVVSVKGRVHNPRDVFFQESITLSKAIEEAGGVLRDARKDRVRIVRQRLDDNIGKEILIVDLQAILEGRIKDVLLKPGDMVIVPRRSSLVSSSWTSLHAEGVRLIV